MTEIPAPLRAGLQRFIAERTINAEPALPEALVAIVGALAAWRPDVPLCYCGDPMRPMAMNVITLADSVAEVEAARAHGERRVWYLANDPTSPELALFLDLEHGPSGRLERIWFSLPPAAHPSLALERLIPLAADLCAGFGAWHGRVEDELLLLLYRAKQVTQRVKASVPPHLREYVPDLPLPGGDQGPLPELLLPTEFDRRQVPDAVWWINYWDSVQVATLGLDRLRRAAFERLLELPNGGVVAGVSELPIDANDPIQLERLRGIIERLELRRLQESCRIGR
jgi:hypothetical protein